MANRLVAVDDEFNLPPEVQAQLTGKFEAEFQTLHDEAETARDDAVTAAGAAAVAAGEAETYAQEAQDAAAEATAPTDEKVEEALNDAITEGRIARGPGDNPEDTGFDVIALIGQSNMVGRAVYTGNSEYLPSPDARVFAFNAKGKNGNEIIKAVDPLVHWGSGEPRTDGFGSGTTFAGEYLNVIPANRKVLLVPAAMGATGFISGAKRWRTTHTPTYDNLYLMALKQIQLALAAAGPGARLVGCLWHQGEADSYLPNPDYAADLNAVLDGIRSTFSVPDMWFLIGQMSKAGFTDSPGRPTINAVQIGYPATKYRTAFAYTPYGAHNDEDTTHFNLWGQRALGRSFARALPLALANTADSLPLPPTAIYSRQGTPGTFQVEWARPRSRFTDFTVQYREPGAGSWSTWAHTASLHNQASIPGTGLGNTLEVQVATINENGTSAFSAIGTVTKTPFPRDVIGTAPWRVFSLRKMVSGYSGNAITVRRSSDNTTANIGFTADGLLDEAALTAFCGTGNGFVVNWYDQTGNTNSFQQSTAAAQPQIVAGGVVLKVGGRPTMKFDGTDDCLFTGISGLTSGMTALFVCKLDVTAGTTRFLSEGSSSSDTPMYGWYTGSTGLISNLWRSDGNVTRTTQIEETLLKPRLQSLMISDSGSGSIRARSNDFVTDPVTRVDGSPGATTVNRQTLMALGRTTFGSWQAGYVSELVEWQSQFNPPNLDTVVANQNEFYSLTV